MRNIAIILYLTLAVMLSGCNHESKTIMSSSQEYAEYFDIVTQDSTTVIIITYPSFQQVDTLWVNSPMDRLICMSSSHVAALSAIGADKHIIGVSGLKYISDQDLKRNDVKDIGYDVALDYEAILELQPDLLVTYAVPGAEPA